MKKEISLANRDYFEIFIGKRVLKSDVYKSKGKIPVYSANVFKPFGFLTESNIDDFSHDCLLWGIDGNFEFNIIKKGVHFATTDHCGVIKILDNKLIPEYLLYELNLKSDLFGYDRALRASLKNMKKVYVDIPKEDDENFDVKKQIEVVNRNEEIKNLKIILYNMSKELVHSRVTIDFIGGAKEVKLGDENLFLIDNGKRITKKDINNAKGEIPVYSASRYKSECLGYVSDKIKEVVPNVKKFKGKYLTVNADGSVGQVFLRDGDFYVNDIVNTIKVSNDSILEEYVLYELRRKLYLDGYISWNCKLYKEKLREITIEIPIDENGDFDLSKQKELANQYMYIDKFKDEIIAEMNKLINATILIE